MKRIFSAIIFSTGLLAASAPFANTLYAGQSLQQGGVISSANGSYYLVLQPGDGNLVVYRTWDNAPIWATNKPGGQVAKMQEDRNFVVYKAGGVTAGYAIWYSHTDRPVWDTQTKLVVRNDGSLYLFGAGNRVVWSSPNDPANPYGSESSEYFAICLRPGTRYQSDSVQAAQNYTEIKQRIGMLINAGGALGECDRTY
jgi:hypothetical protein